MLPALAFAPGGDGRAPFIGPGMKPLERQALQTPTRHHPHRMTRSPIFGVAKHQLQLGDRSAVLIMKTGWSWWLAGQPYGRLELKTRRWSCHMHATQTSTSQTLRPTGNTRAWGSRSTARATKGGCSR